MAYLGVDIGGTKTLIAVFNDKGEIKEHRKFLTPKKYDDFTKRLSDSVARLTTKKFIITVVAVPGRVDRAKGIGIAFGNLEWRDVPIKSTVEKIAKCPVIIENDAKLAGLSEAILLKDEYKRVLYLTISTGIGGGVIINGIIDPTLADSEPGELMLDYQGKLRMWESFASGKAIVKNYGKQAHEIKDPEVWHKIASDLAIGIFDLIATVQPEVIVIGGSVGVYLDKFKDFLMSELKQYENPLVPIPHIRQAARPNEAVVFGCYDLARGHDAKAA